jgi:4'-phosphopantetheinyl transferase EntD
LGRLSQDELLIGFRLIEPGDDLLLYPEEMEQLGRAVMKVRRQSGAARALARDFLRGLGVPPCPIMRGVRGAPVWPKGVIGSLAHDRDVAVAAVARSGIRRSGIGVDVEPDESLDQGILASIASPSEIAQLEGRNPRLLFCAKEAAFKAVNSVSAPISDFREIEVDLKSMRAWTRDGVTTALSWIERPRIVVLAVR